MIKIITLLFLVLITFIGCEQKKTVIDEKSKNPLQDINVINILAACDTNGYFIGEWIDENNKTEIKLFCFETYYVLFDKNELGILTYQRLDNIKYYHSSKVAILKNDSTQLIFKLIEGNNVVLSRDEQKFNFVYKNDIKLEDRFSKCLKVKPEIEGTYYLSFSGPELSGISLYDNNKYCMFQGSDISNSYEELGSYYINDDTIFIEKNVLNVYTNSFILQKDGGYKQKLIETKKLKAIKDTLFIDFTFPEITIYEKCCYKIYNKEKELISDTAPKYYVKK